jgi:hypothetical protein
VDAGDHRKVAETSTENDLASQMQKFVDALLSGGLCIVGRAEVHMAARGRCHSGFKKERLDSEA